MADQGFPKHFDGRCFYNPEAPQARGFLDGLRWKLTSHPELSPPFIEDVMPSVPPRSERRSGPSHDGEPLDGACSTLRLQSIDGSNLVGTSKSTVLDWSQAPEKAWRADGRSSAH